MPVFLSRVVDAASSRGTHGCYRNRVFFEEPQKPFSPLVAGGNLIHAMQKNKERVVEFAGALCELRREDRRFVGALRGHGKLTVPEPTVVGTHIPNQCQVVQP